jgi:hypothetical protein
LPFHHKGAARRRWRRFGMLANEDIESAGAARRVDDDAWV